MIEHREDNGVRITDFLLARIAEDEDAEGIVRRGYIFTARDRRECEAKRRIVDLHPIEAEEQDVGWGKDSWGKNVYDQTPSGVFLYGCGQCDEMENNDRDWYTSCLGTIPGCLTLRALADVYADHPDYDPAWSSECGQIAVSRPPQVTASDRI